MDNYLKVINNMLFQEKQPKIDRLDDQSNLHFINVCVLKCNKQKQKQNAWNGMSHPST